MSACPSCGEKNAAGSRFCSACGTELAPSGEVRREVRKLVTLVFGDLAGYTRAGESLDPEALRRVQQRYFETARSAVERHGGTVEKFIGDAVMAVFGVPQMHEDDALRAIRAACELREGVQALGLRARIGINTGDVITAAADALVTGDAVNVAARLEQAAAPGEILMGAATHRLCRNAVRAEHVEPLALKGKTEPVAAIRLLGVFEDAPAVARRLDAPLVGRSTELARVRACLDEAVAERACRTVTAVGSPGIGKSRLAREFVANLDGAAALTGRCLPYGEGITYWPLVEMFREADAEDELGAALSAIAVLEGVGERSYRSTAAAVLAQVLNVQGRHSDAEAQTRLSEELASIDDMPSQIAWRTERARAAAHQGKLAEAERLVREACSLAQPTDALDTKGECALARAEIMRLGGRIDEAVGAATQALDMFERKGVVSSVEQARALLAELQVAA
ncbi:MAG: AAA family ATPase [Thermoleophilia bacterium]|nr:AAA family ATPase [Thermoleophilia bacterium]